MKKFILVTFIVLFGAYLALDKVKKVKLMEDNYVKLDIQNVSPEKFVFAFDLHDVILRLNLSQIARALIQIPFTDLLFLLLHPKIYYYLYNLALKKIWVDQIYDELIFKYPDFVSLKPFFINLINAQKIDLCMVEIIKELRQLGYSTYILSNIWQPAFQDFQKTHPELLDLFDGYYVPTNIGQYLHKPKLDFYLNFKKYVFEKEKDKKVIFIDESFKNTKESIAAGFYGILFKSPEQLSAILKNLIPNFDLLLDYKMQLTLK